MRQNARSLTAGTPTIPPPTPNRLTRSQIAGYLETIFTSPTLAKYGSYFFLQNVNQGDFLSCVGHAIDHDAHDPTTPYRWDYYKDCRDANRGGRTLAPHVSLFVRVIDALKGDPVFTTQQGEIGQVFVLLDAKRNILLPYEIAALMSATFFKGLVMRLILSQYKINWQGLIPGLSLNLSISSPPNPPPTSTPPHTVPPALIWTTDYLTSLTAKLTSRTAWDNVGSNDYNICLSNLTDSAAQVAGILTGWMAGDDLIEGNPSDAAACKDAIWKLIGSRYTTRQLGMMIGYSFSYLSGFLKNERTNAIAGGSSKTPDPETNIAVILSSLTKFTTDSRNSGYSTKDPVYGMANYFFSLVLGEFYAISQKPSNSTTANALTSYKAFIEGYEQGLTLGADVMFSILYKAGYESGWANGYSIGYSNGFRDGFSQGYGAGWQAGYASGYQAGQSTWNSLTNIITGIGNVIGEGSNTINTILSDAGTVGTVLGALF